MNPLISMGVRGPDLGGAAESFTNSMFQSQQAAQRKQAASREEQMFQLGDMATDAIQIMPLIQSGDLTRANVKLAERIDKIKQRNGDPSHTMAYRDALNSGQLTPEQAAAELGNVITAAERAGILNGSNIPAGQRQFNSLLDIVRPAMDANGQIDPTKLTAEQRAAANELGLTAKIGTFTASERTATTPGMTDAVAESESTIEGEKAAAKESAKLAVQGKLLPNIRAAIKEEEDKAKSRGESLSEYGRAKAAMPGLVEVSNKLKSLADVATYTTAGKTVDLLAKELGFGATKGATARAAMVSVVDNQVLPLLRDTFGAAFTAAEGERLRDTFLDPDATPEAKKASLDALIDQKYRNLETKERELGIAPSAMQQPAQGTNNEDAAAIEWARANPSDPRAQKIMQMHGGR